MEELRAYLEPLMARLKDHLRGAKYDWFVSAKFLLLDSKTKEFISKFENYGSGEEVDFFMETVQLIRTEQPILDREALNKNLKPEFIADIESYWKLALSFLE